MQTRTERGHRVVVTGVGLVTPVGIGVEETWTALVAGTSGAACITHFEATPDYDVAMAASQEALASAGLDPVPAHVDRDRIGVIIGSGIGGIATFEDQARVMVERGPRRISPFFVPMFIPDIAAGHVSMRYGLRGPNYATVSACASSAHAVGDAFRIVQRGDADIMVAGGTEATITPLTIAGFANMKALSTRNESPETASRPFDGARDGFVLGEGAGTLVLESLEYALDRGATILGEVTGFGQSADAYHLTAPAPEGAGAQLAMRRALEDAGLSPADIDYINAHGTSTPMNDASETAAVKAVLGEHAHKLVMGSTKSMTGHLLGAAGAVEAVITLLACKHDDIPPTINFSIADPACDLDYAHNRRVRRPVRAALTNSFGFGGHNVCLALQEWNGG
jgi:3-oxoacyl-[acyl-carrier-protein] synthase II